MPKLGKSKFKFKEKKKPECSKRGRLIIRNLPFDVTEEALQKYFSQFGDLKEVNILKRPDGKLVGCGFVQFSKKLSAAKAIHHASGKSFMGRVIIVDWAIPKNKFVESNKLIKKESPDKLLDENIQESINSENFDDTSENEISDKNQDSRNIDSSEDEDNEDNDKCAVELERTDEKSNVKFWPESHDIPEGKTVFLKNVPFNITNHELKAFMETVGPVFYAVICIDPLTEHSKGTAFVKFKHKMHADRCVESTMELKLKGTLMQALPALEKRKIFNKEREKHPDKKKDNRNLYLIKEGVVIAGTSAAVNVSMADMKRRLELELWKSNMLKNLNMFISKTRLIIHNLPPTYDDKMLRLLFKKYAPPKSRITEAKVMRNLRQLDKDNKPVSKGYGFVSFIEHEHALATLRKINNNPTVFNKNKRPIVAFSIENRAVIKVKQKRMEKSKLNNSLCPDSKKPKIDGNNKKIETKLRKRNRSENVSSFSGIEAHPGHTQLPSKRKVLNQGKIHFQNVKESKKENKRKQQILDIRKEKKKEPKIKMKKKDTNFDEKQFNQLINKYKQQIVPNISLKKWYEQN